MSTETLRPSGAGSQTELTPSAGANWENVDDVSQDGDATTNTLHCPIADIATATDLYDLNTSSIPVGSTINSVQIFARAKVVNPSEFNNIFLQYSDGVGSWYVAPQQLTATYDLYSSPLFTLNLVFSTPWILDEVNNLQIGAQIDLETIDDTADAYVTQMYAIVDYTPPSSPADSGNMFHLFSV